MSSTLHGTPRTPGSPCAIRVRLLLLAVLSSLFFPVPASADDVADAKAKFRAGAAAYRQGRYEDAIDLFLQANRLDPQPALIFNVAQVYEKVGDVPSALRSYRDYLRLVPETQDRAAVEKSIRDLEQRLRDKGVQQVTVLSKPAGARVFLDGVEVGSTPTTFETTPGEHALVLKSSGHPDASRAFTLAGDRSMDVDVTMSRTVETAPAPSPAAPGPAAPASTSAPAPRVGAASPPAAETPRAPSFGIASVRPWTWAAFGVSAIGLGSAIGFEVARAGSESAARVDPTQVGFKEKYDAMIANQTGARVMVGIGAAAAVAGGVLLFLDTRSPGRAPSRGKAVSDASVGLGCSAAGCGVVVGGHL